MEDLPDDLAMFWYLTRRIAGLLDRSGEAVFRSRIGVSLAQFLVLSVVDAYPGRLSQQAVADRLGLTKGTVSRQLDAAMSSGLLTVQSSPVSRRENVVALTPAGTDLVRRGDEVFREVRGTLLPTVDPADLAATLRVLGAFDDALSTRSRRH